LASADAVTGVKLNVMMQPEARDNGNGFDPVASSSLTTASDLSDSQDSVFSRIFGCFSKPVKDLHPENRLSIGRQGNTGIPVIRPAVGETRRRRWLFFPKQDRNTTSATDQHAVIRHKVTPPVACSEEATLRSQLASLKLSALRQRAISAGASCNEVDSAIDEEDPRSALIALILAKQDFETQVEKDKLLYPATASSELPLPSSVLPEAPSRTVSADELPENLRRWLQAEETRRSRKFQCFSRIENCSARGRMRCNSDETMVTNISALRAASEGALAASALVREFSSDLDVEGLEDSPPRVKASTL
jgi:hypothetical protein